MKKKILTVLVAIGLSQVAFSNVDPKLSAPNQFDCTVDELELYVLKRTENLRKKSTISTWEDYKVTAAKAEINGKTNSAAAGDSAANGNATAEALEAAKNEELNKTGGGEGLDGEEETCNMFFSEIEDVDMSDTDIDFSNIGNPFNGGLSGLTDMATAQVSQLGESLMNVLKEGMCERLSSDYLLELGTDALDDMLGDEIGYTTGDISGGNFANEVVNDQLKEEHGTSNAKMYNIMDQDLNNKRESYMNKMLNNKLDDIEDEILDF